MPLVVFFHNVRDDNARRTGVVVDGRRLLDYFVPGDEEDTPALRWYFDMILPSESPSATAAEAREWVSAHADTIRQVVEKTAARLAAGIDTDFQPWSYEYPADEFPAEDGRVRMSLAAIRRYDARHVAENLRKFLVTDFLVLTEAAVPAA